MGAGWMTRKPRRPESSPGIGAGLKPAPTNRALGHYFVHCHATRPCPPRPCQRPRIVLALALLALVVSRLLTSSVTHAQATVPDITTYESWLREALVAASRSDRLGLEQVAERLTSTMEVQTTDGATVPVDNRWLAQALAEPDPDFPQIATRLSALLDAVVQPPSAAPPDAIQSLQDILSRPPFAAVEPPEEGAWDWLLQWIEDLLERLLAPVFDVGTGTGSVLGWIVIAICGLLLAGVLLYLFLNMRRALTAEAQATAPDDYEAGLTAATALQQANDLARGGDYRTAVRYLYLSSLLWLDERGLLRYDRALTNREYLKNLADNPQLRSQLQPIVETFDQVWYGHAPLDDERFLAYQQQVETLRRSQR